MSQEKKKKSLIVSIMGMSVIPILLLGIALTVYSQVSVREGMVFEIRRGLSGIAHNLISTYNMLDAGDYSYENGVLKKGETELTSDYRILDDLKMDTGADVTIAMGETRCLTTLVDEDGNRQVGTKVSDKVAKVVLEKGEEYFSEKVDVNGREYFGYYVPIFDSNNKVIGFSFAGRSSEYVTTSMSYMTKGNMVICVFVVLLVGWVCYISSNRIVETIHHIKNFLGKLSGGDFKQKMPEKVLDRGDELAEMGDYAVNVQTSLSDMVTKDPLTSLLNRRACLVEAEKRKGQETFSLALADIDYFKKINDTYGHDMGDLVLQSVAADFMEIIGDDGFVSRWGGEEFLIGLDASREEMRKRMDEAAEKIAAKEYKQDDETFQITITIGVVSSQKNENFEECVRRADQLLYLGKKGGRNQIVEESNT